MTHDTTSPPAVLLCAGILALAACSGPAEESGVAQSPIERYMSAGDGTQLSEAERKEQGDAWLLANEELIAACMNEQGFDYVPHPPTPMGFDFSTLTSPDLDDPEWVQRYGYGIVHGPETEVVTIAEDPNEAVLASLSQPEVNAYYVALSGGSGAYTADDEYIPEKGGCQGAAQIELDSRDPLRGDEFRPLRDAVNDFYTSLMTTAEIAELDARWADCMDAAGFGPYTLQLDALAEINADLVVMANERGGNAQDDPEMEKLGAREIEVALADLACREETDYRASYDAIRTTLEERFVEDHLAELESFKAAAEQTGVAD